MSASLKTTVPNFDNFEVSPTEYYHLLERMAATLTVWNARDLNMPGPYKPIELEGLNSKYQAYARGCCIVVAPVSVFDPERTQWQALQAAHILVYHAIVTRGWDKIELTGLNTMVSRALVTSMVLDATALRCNITEKENKIVDMYKKNPPDWAKSQGVPRQTSGQ